MSKDILTAELLYFFKIRELIVSEICLIRGIRSLITLGF